MQNVNQPHQIKLTMYVVVLRGSKPAKLGSLGYATRKEAAGLVRDWNRQAKLDGVPSRWDVSVRHVYANVPTY